jgi:hypothetical protein
LNKFLENHDSWDVLIIGGNIVPPYTPIDDTCVKVINCQTTTGYLIKSDYYDKLIQNYREGIQKLINYPEQHKIYAIDKYWFRLQEVDNWYMIIPLTVTQREDYSDIEKKATNYSNVMLDLEKVWFKKITPNLNLTPNTINHNQINQITQINQINTNIKINSSPKVVMKVTDMKPSLNINMKL